ncbi:hypothetical protein PAPYR_6988 [Paratrimastix pyriformis]|uniref:PSI domain-containing protein n=1 Tax=Paratrimastix pyriformis TaxID=342808 RepID=A0ABQ8UE38_9EUKA|nr:hypothetical protein PAPYR_6988 [Paratrimastix pyriformis]
MNRVALVSIFLFLGVALADPGQNLDVNCDIFSSCQNCTSSSCKWCESTSTCVSGSLSCPTSFCGFRNPTQCPKVTNCTILSDCHACTVSGCAWCGADQSCHPVDTDEATLCDGHECSACLRTAPTECPVVGNCSALTSCLQCAQSGCKWWSVASPRLPTHPGDMETCFEADSHTGLACRPDQVPAAAQACQQCPVGPGSASLCPSHPVYLSGPPAASLLAEAGAGAAAVRTLLGNVAPVRCSDVHGCRACAESGCLWCGQSQRCLEVSLNTSAVCSGAACGACARAEPHMCPNTPNCSALHDCMSCTLAMCEWCGATETCHEYDPSSMGFCEGTGGLCPQCTKTRFSECPLRATCADQHSCTACTQNHCKWCGDTQTCLDFDHQTGTTCGAANCTGCLKSSPSFPTPMCTCAHMIILEDECPAVAQCDALTNCLDCATAGCAWCGATRRCMEADATTGALCGAQHASSPPLGDVHAHLLPLPVSVRGLCVARISADPQRSHGCMIPACLHAPGEVCGSIPPPPSWDLPLQAGCRPWGAADAQSCPGCLKARQAECPRTADCATLQDCRSCTRADCHWSAQPPPAQLGPCMPILCPFYAHSMPILCPFYAHSMPILCPFYAHSMPILCPFYAHSMPILCPFYAHSMPILCPFYAHSMPILCPFYAHAVPMPCPPPLGSKSTIHTIDRTPARPCSPPAPSSPPPRSPAAPTEGLCPDPAHPTPAPCAACAKSSPATCPVTPSCADHGDCFECTINMCAWCSASMTCTEYDPTSLHDLLLIFSTLSRPPAFCRRGRNGTQCAGAPCAGCYKTDPLSCPRVPSCAQMTSCGSCAHAGCAWCRSTGQCLEFNAEGTGPCPGAQCPPDQLTTDCGCGKHTDCASCVAQRGAQGECGWCQPLSNATAEGGICTLGNVNGSFVTPCPFGHMREWEWTTCPAPPAPAGMPPGEIVSIVVVVVVLAAGGALIGLGFYRKKKAVHRAQYTLLPETSIQ